ncbi:MAG: hypothetical protein CK552_04570 [Actinobacteria bacterium]|nr:MAG: hypothetical protein CK552_04570 [Actinomycetota bacterium]
MNRGHVGPIGRGRTPANYGGHSPRRSSCGRVLDDEQPASINGDVDHSTGLGGEDSGCQSDNSTCNSAQYLADNAVNRVYPELVAPAAGNYSLTPATAAALAAQRVAIPAFN